MPTSSSPERAIRERSTSFLFAVIRHRAVANMFLNGEKARQDAVLDARASAQKAAADLDAVDAELGKQLESSGDWQAIKTEWNSLQSRVLALAPDDSTAQHDDLIFKLLDFARPWPCIPAWPVTRSLLSARCLTLDRNVCPQRSIEAGIMRDRATAGVLRGYLGEGDRTTIAMSRQEVASMLAQIDRQLNGPRRTSHRCALVYVPAFEKARETSQATPTFVEQKSAEVRNRSP